MTEIIRKCKPIQIDVNTKVEDMFFSQIGMTREKALKRFESKINDAQDKVRNSIRIEAVYESFPITSAGEDRVCFAGVDLESEMLPKVLEKSTDVILYVISGFGYDDVEDAETDTFDLMMIDGWGTAFIEEADSILMDHINSELKEIGNLYSTHSWSPGQHNVDIKLQRQLFDLLKPEEIGTELSKSFMMHPKKSVSGIIGIGSDKNAPQMRACDFCKRRDTCPSAYS